MEEIIFSIVLFALVTITIKWISSWQLKKQTRQTKALLEKLKRIEVNTDTIIVDGINYNESVPLDVYGTELNPDDSTFYRGTGLNNYSMRKRFHKQETITRFKSTFYIPIIYQNQEYKFSTNLPIDQITLRMKFYMQKEIPVYVQEFNGSGKTTGVKFFLDFRFLNVKSINLVTTNYYKVK
ncbi:hypothetical protein [Zobellia sp. B3R18]|uniref:hypothetical protein n=1 Tax=Zobellia sp. B3R18 TaxID=2841568 RepID=UPI001C079A5E|nr:hypothetical protein [Zobellia sp. B3R18]MBU2976059.1 hypothetical protein [Zobellia sp. B3R18]